VLPGEPEAENKREKKTEARVSTRKQRQEILLRHRPDDLCKMGVFQIKKFGTTIVIVIIYKYIFSLTLNTPKIEHI